jgi:hypothetical protein
MGAGLLGEEIGVVSEPLLTARQLAEHLGISAATVLDRFERGDLPGFKLWGTKGGPVRFRLSEIEQTLAGWHIGPSRAGGEAPATPTAGPARGVVSQVPATPLGGQNAS